MSLLLLFTLMSAHWLHAKSSTWWSKRLFMIIMIYLSSLNPGLTLPWLISKSKFLAMSFSSSPHKFGNRNVVYIINSFKVQIIDNFPITTDVNSQQLWLKVQWRKSKSFLLCTAYRPDSVFMFIFQMIFTASFMDSPLLGMEVTVTGDQMQMFSHTLLVLGAGFDGSL